MEYRENEPMSEMGYSSDLNLELDDKDIEIIRSKKISGKAFLSLTKEEFKTYGLQLRLAIVITELIKEIKGETKEEDLNRHFDKIAERLDHKIDRVSQMKKVQLHSEVMWYIALDTNTEIDKGIFVGS
ncbi:7955_t:CDS:2 [Funneliformis caledonium]|uniref:7955_t:CDS:1 n=1 Tax=Funneliformis caledonium TaxID=1117310 RepID=A0A9N9EVL2_9GLOM|nr:7955_t:CDS:2 [Funneliformis caledonium]